MANIFVQEVFGQSASLGQIEAVVGMVTNYGTIIGISGSLLQIGSGTGQNHAWMYNHELSVLESDMATTNYGWPTGVTCIPFDRSTAFPNGFVADKNSITGSTYFNGTSAVTVTR